MRGGHYIRILYVGWPLHKDSLCGVAIAYNSLYGEEAIYIYIYMHAYQESLVRGGHYIRILYVGRPLHKDSVCGVAIA